MKHAAVVGAMILTMGTLAAPAQANDGAIQYRQAVFQAIGGHMTALVRIVRREVAHTDDITVHANGIADLAPLTAHIFPEGSGEGRTDALPAIWRNADDFARRREAFVEAAEGLRAAAGGPMGEFVGAFQTLGGTCSGCHDNFRAD
jgi:cytochrome c556